TIMESLRAMRDRGDLSDEEFQAARRRLVDRVRAEPASGGDAADTSKTPDASVTSRAGAAGLRARPGFDLTGAPLPPSTDDPSTPNNREDPPPA
ncbi:MAG: SHOCT domain-containing protein, partial [Planctomycetota bacterium]